MAEDVAALIKYLHIEKADVMGYSMGGGVALRIAVQHPTVVRKLILVSTVFKRDGWYPEIVSAMSQMGPATAEQLKQPGFYRLYASIAPNPRNWPVLIAKLGEWARKDYDWSNDVAAIQVPTLLVFGDADAVLPRIWSSSSGSLAAVRGTAAGTDQEYPTPASLSCRG